MTDKTVRTCKAIIGKGKKKHVCGEPVRYAVGSLCEDCYMKQSARYHGKDQSVKTLN